MKPATRTTTLVLTLLAAVLMFTNVAWAGPRDHDGGFFLRMSAGLGGASSEINNLQGPLVTDLKFSGAAGDWNFAIGGVVSRNLALHGTFWGWTLTDPEVTLNGTVFPGQGSFNMSAFGVGITYYFMPVNIYISPSLGVGVLSVDGGGASGSSDAGFALDVTLGKEWWIGNKWGMGLSGALGYHSIADGGEDVTEKWSGTSFALRFSVTLN
jgi:hypothetical protein